MRMFLVWLLLSLTGTISHSDINAGDKGINFESSKWAEILSKAEKENKIIFLDAYASWCSPCKWMAKNVFTNDTAAEFYNRNFINAKIDMENGEGIELASKYGVSAYPTLLYINSKGEVVYRICGSVPTSVFVQNGRNALNPEKQLITYKNKFDSGKYNSQFFLEYITVMNAGCMSYEEELDKYFSTQSEEQLVSKENWNLINTYLNNPRSDVFKYLIKKKVQFEQLYTKDTVENKIYFVYSEGLNQHLRERDFSGYELLKEEFKKSGMTDVEKAVLNSDLTFYKIKKDWKNYVFTASALIDKYEGNEYALLNKVSWTIFESVDDNAALLKAKDWAKRSVELNEQYANTDTYAAVLYKLGQKDEARKAALRAIELAKIDNQDYSSTQELLDNINKLPDKK